MKQTTIKYIRFFKHDKRYVRCSICYKLIPKDPVCLFTHNHNHLFTGNTEDIKIRTNYTSNGTDKEAYIYLTLFKN